MSQLLTVFPTAKPNKRWNYTVQPVAMEPGQTWGTPTCMCCGSLLMFFFPSFSFFFSYSTHQGARLSALSTISNRICSCLGHAEKAQIPSPAPGGLPLRSTLDVWLPTRAAAAALKAALYFGSSAVLCSARSCCASLLTALSVTWRS